MEIHFEIENRCLLNCRHCSSNANMCGIAFNYTMKDMLHFLAKIAEEKTIFFTGGEPLLNENFKTILNQIKKYNHNSTIGVFTSGITHDQNRLKQSISEKQAVELASNGLQICYVSMYSHEDKEHNWMTNTPNSFQLTQESITNLHSAGIEIRFNTVITKKNINKIEQILQLASLWNVTEVRLLKLINHGRASQVWDKIGISDEEYKNTTKTILSKTYPIRITASSAIDIIACRPFKNAVKCQAGQNLLYVTFNGDIFPCASVKNITKYKIGNIKDKNMIEKYSADNGSFRNYPLCQS